MITHELVVLVSAISARLSATPPPPLSIFCHRWLIGNQRGLSNRPTEHAINCEFLIGDATFLYPFPKSTIHTVQSPQFQNPH